MSLAVPSRFFLLSMPPSYDTAAKLIALDAVDRAVSRGSSLRAACEDAGHSVASISRWKAEREAGQLADARRTASGRKAAVQLSDAEAQRLKQLVLEKDGSLAAAVEFLAKDAVCSPGLRGFIAERVAASRSAPRETARPPAWPVSLRRAGHVTAEELAAWRGKKAAAGMMPTARRSLDWIDEDGVEHRLLPHDIWLFDDYSTNQPYYLQFSAGQWRCCRQVLAGMDLFTNAWLGFLHVGRERDAYTAGDCSRVILDCIDAQGTMPRVVLLEQGRWKADALRGVKLENGRRWGGLEEAGFKVSYGFTSRHKAEIESGFHMLQTWLGETGSDIGRDRGEMELASKNYMLVNEGKRDPKLCGFIPLAQSSEAHISAGIDLNDRRKMRQDLGYVSANELYADGTPAPRPLAEDKRWLFLPVKKLATIHRGMLTSDHGGMDNAWVVNGVRDGVFLGDNHKVVVAFDPDRPDLGAVIANAESGPRNRDGWRMGEILLTAPPFDTVPRVDLRSSAEDMEADQAAGWKKRQGAVKASQHAFRSILPDGRRGMRSDRAKNRLGESAEATTGRPHPAHAASDEIPAAPSGRECPAPRFADPGGKSESPARCLDTPRLSGASQRLLTPHSESEELAALAALEADL